MRLLGGLLVTVLANLCCLGQTSNSACDTSPWPGACPFLTDHDRGSAATTPVLDTAGPKLGLSDYRAPARDSADSFIFVSNAHEKRGFHWGRALFESFALLSIEHAYVVHDDWRYVGGNQSENGIPFNHYWRDYKHSLATWLRSGWNDGDPNMYGYVGHPIQGVAASYIYLQNDPKSEKLEFSNTKAYWKSRFMATLWNAAYSTQWNIGPVSEMTVEKYGTVIRPPWGGPTGGWPVCVRHCQTGVGQIDLVMTPVGGFGWLVGEDILDRYVARRVERTTRNRFLIDLTRLTLDPVRAGTNMLHGKRPWYRPSRDAADVYFTVQPSRPRPPSGSDGSR